ncbi:terpenoid synthase [Clathrospora elynae]|uniref:Terpene synthase n=1 Tax=Clathrospora elynae TaxID=706981 RepID=A0A6A5SNU8_9PLEO|nr:terpenoid synthase [Clathrospora elynae]
MNAQAIAEDDQVSDIMDIAQYNTHGLCPGYVLRRNKAEAEADGGSEDARADWVKYIGPIDRYGSWNPFNGHVCATLYPTCLPERLRLVSYLWEYAFMFDDKLELEKVGPTHVRSQPFARSQSEMDAHQIKVKPPQNDAKNEWEYMDPAQGKTFIQAQMIAQLAAADSDQACSKRIMRTWQTMLTTTLHGKDKAFTSLDEYLDFRIVDTGANWVEALLLFGLQISLTPEEDALLFHLRHPCYATLSLANDYFSFDVEYVEFLSSPQNSPRSFVNAVWLFMQWHGVDVDEAKEMTRLATIEYAERFLVVCSEFRKKGEVSAKVDRYLRALAYQVPGNVIWSESCPRYFPERMEERAVGHGGGVGNGHEGVKNEHVGNDVPSNGDVSNGHFSNARMDVKVSV